ncbi:MAG: YegS/Rv2252/BmrU family lipid kinase [Anaerolineae bacterium]|nr:YegS/Rv2252/BmrU family lipid kinase [Anaerolineae bacterium]
MPRIKIITNPSADRGHASDLAVPLQQQIKSQALAASGSSARYSIDWAFTEGPRHATALALQAAQEGYDTVVAVGGDGTVHEVINGLMQVEVEKRPILGVIPVGSGNDFAHNLGLPSTSIEAGLAIFHGQPRAVDVGIISDGNGRAEYWNNTIGVGFSGAVNTATRKLTWLRGFLIYLVGVLQTIITRPLKVNASIRIDDETIERKVAMVSICNGPREGGGFPVAPTAIMDDGLISYSIMRGMSRLQMLYFVPVVMNAKQLNYPDFFSFGTARTFGLSAGEALDVHLDGEIFARPSDNVQKIQASMLPAALRVWAPA